MSTIAQVVQRTVAALGVVACSGGGSLLDGEWVTFESGRVRLHARPDAGVCAGNARRLERLLVDLERYLNRSAAETVDYYYLRGFIPLEREELQELCAGREERNYDVAGCAFARDSRVLASSLGNTHELAHLVANRETDDPLPFLSEGIAVSFEGHELRAITERFDLLELFDQMRGPGEARMRAGIFVGYLMDRFGLEPILLLHDQCRSTTSFEEFEEHFVDIFGVTPQHVADEIVDRGISYGPGFGWCEGLAPPTVIEPTVILEREAVCGEESTGTDEDPVILERLQASGGFYRISFEGSGWFSLSSCEREGGHFQRSSDDVPDRVTYFSALGAEGHRLTSRRGPVSLVFNEATRRERCELELPQELWEVPREEQRLYFIDEGPWAVPLLFTEPRTLSAFVGSPLLLCDERCECERLDRVVRDGECSFDCPQLPRLTVESGVTYWIVNEEETQNPGWITLE